MIKYFLITICLFFSLFGFSQEQATDSIAEEVEEVDVPFMVVETSPIYPGCENQARQFQKNCFDNSVKKYFAQNYDFALANSLDLKPGNTRIDVSFVVAADSTITEIKVKGEHRALEKEAVRLINALPKIIPGTIRGKPFDTEVKFPITLKISNVKSKKSKKN